MWESILKVLKSTATFCWRWFLTQDTLIDLLPGVGRS